MTNKSHVSLESHLCVVCGKPYDTGAILLDRRLRQSLEPHTMTGWGLCPEHQALHDQGWVALVECDPDRSEGPDPEGRIDPVKAYRTGRIAHVKREHVAKVIKVPIPADLPLVFVEPAVMDMMWSPTVPLEDPRN